MIGGYSASRVGLPAAFVTYGLCRSAGARGEAHNYHALMNSSRNHAKLNIDVFLRSAEPRVDPGLANWTDTDMARATGITQPGLPGNPDASELINATSPDTKTENKLNRDARSGSADRHHRRSKNSPRPKAIR